MKKHKAAPDDRCPCGSGSALPDCCGQYLDGRTAAPTAEHLMRSRYTAYMYQRADYLLATWHPTTRPATLDLPPTQWLGLSVAQHLPQDGTHATVAFVARYKVGGRAHRLAETSRFVCEDGRWFYLDGEIGE
ncbi:MAG: YchJ family metal-binding protein [Rhodocyclaceae bacterium]|nr:YchJ family metal-binding protein [Rhodocyclaceae bacterium]MDZ4216043.1 YchJ family metal-binding protein [Rhodocyclaceae bacterium]